MRKMRSACVVMAVVVGAVVPVTAASSALPPAAANLACAVQVVSSWPLTQIANETIVVSVKAMNVAAMVPASSAGFGGLLLFGDTGPSTMATLLARVQAHAPQKFPMLVMTDEEGGGVERLTNFVGSFPWAHTMGLNLSASRITAIAQRVGAALHAVGVTVDLAPVLDVDGRAAAPSATNPDGMRSFSALAPFEKAIAGGVPAVMLSNASVPGLTALPASLSPAVVSELRQQLGFRGLIVTDSLSAGAISAIHLSEPAAMVRALQAGADLVLNGSPGTPANSLAQAQRDSNAVVAAVTNGTLSRSTLIAAAAQVLATRNVVACETPTS